MQCCFFYFKDKRRIDPLALFASATIIDLEPLYYFIIGEPLDHRLWHGFAFSLTIYPALISLGAYLVEHFFENKSWSTYVALKLKPEKARYSLLSIYVCSILGGSSHVFFDMFTHESMPYVVYPLVFDNPFYLGQAAIAVEAVVIALALYSVFCWWKTAKTGFNRQRNLKILRARVLTEGIS